MNRDIVQIIKALGSENSVAGAFDIIIERYSERLYWHIRRIVVLHEDAQDLLQDTFVAAYRSVSGFRGDSESSLLAWLYKIATMLSIKCLRRRRRNIFTSIDSLSGTLLADFDGEIAADADEVVVALQRAVLELPVKQRLVFNLRYYDELSFEEISSITGQSVATLKTNYHYATKRVKQRVIEFDYE